MFNEWCDIAETTPAARKKLCGVSEKGGGRVAIKARLVRQVRSHYDDLARVQADIERLGFPAAAAILGERLPRTARLRSGEMGEILATEFVEFYTDFRIPVRRLRYKDGREMALRGDDFVGIDRDADDRLLLLKGESKSRANMNQATVTEARTRLSADNGRPTPISLLFVADRLMESGDADDQNLGRAIRDEIANKSVPPRRITHGFFTLSANGANGLLEADLMGADDAFTHVSIGFRVADHQDFIRDIFEEALNLGDA